MGPWPPQGDGEQQHSPLIAFMRLSPRGCSLWRTNASQPNLLESEFAATTEVDVFTQAGKHLNHLQEKTEGIRISTLEETRVILVGSAALLKTGSQGDTARPPLGRMIQLGFGLYCEEFSTPASGNNDMLA